MQQQPSPRRRRAPGGRASAAATALVALVLAASCCGPATCATLAGAKAIDPVSKVVELLTNLQKQLTQEATQDAAQKEEQHKFLAKQQSDLIAIINKTDDGIQSLESQAKQVEATRVSDQSRLEKTAGELASAEKDLAAAIEVRKAEKGTFDSNEADLLASADQLDRALQVLAKKAGGASAAFLDVGLPEAPHGASLLSIAHNLRENLESSQDMELSELQRETLNSFVRLAEARSGRAGNDMGMGSGKGFDNSLLRKKEEKTKDENNKDGKKPSSAPTAAPTTSAPTPATTPAPTTSDPTPAPTSAPTATAAPTPAPALAAVALNQEPKLYGDYNSQSSGVMQTLQTVQDKTQKQLAEARAKESEAVMLFKKMQQSLEEEVENKKAAIADLKTRVSRAMEQSGQFKADILAAKKLLQSSKQDLDRVTAESLTQLRTFAERTKKRNDELLAIKEALQILESYKTPQAPKASSAKLYELPASLLQVGQTHHKGTGRTSHDAATLGLSLMEIQSTSRSRSLSDTSDPFKKVKSMIRDMLRKLEGQQSADQKQAEWCDSELAKSAKSKQLRERDVTKTKDRIQELEMDVEQLGSDINDTTRELAELRNATQTAVKLRKSEATNAQASLLQYKAAQKLIKGAIQVLTRVYSQKAQETAEKGDSGYEVSDMGGGVIGILEVAEADVAKMAEELTLSEETSQKYYNDFMSDSEVREAVFEKDLEYKERSKVKMTGSKMRASNDLKSLQKELDAINSYLSNLKASCTIRGDSYEERQARLSKTLQGLKEALNYLTGSS